MFRRSNGCQVLLSCKWKAYLPGRRSVKLVIPIKEFRIFSSPASATEGRFLAINAFMTRVLSMASTTIYVRPISLRSSSLNSILRKVKFLQDLYLVDPRRSFSWALSVQIRLPSNAPVLINSPGPSQFQQYFTRSFTCYFLITLN